MKNLLKEHIPPFPPILLRPQAQHHIAWGQQHLGTREHRHKLHLRHWVLFVHRLNRDEVDEVGYLLIGQHVGGEVPEEHEDRSDEVEKLDIKFVLLNVRYSDNHG